MDIVLAASEIEDPELKSLFVEESIVTQSIIPPVKAAETLLRMPMTLRLVIIWQVSFSVEGSMTSLWRSAKPSIGRSRALPAIRRSSTWLSGRPIMTPIRRRSG